MQCLRMYADQNGDSHFEDVEVEASGPGSKVERSSLFSSTNVGFRRHPPDFSIPLTPARRRLFVFILTGEVELAVSNGAVRRIGPRSVVLVEDTSGKGHSVRILGSETSLQAVVQLDEPATRRDGAEASAGAAEVNLIRATERERLRALVNADLEAARRLHAEDFQLINPGGASLSKEQYLGGIASGKIHYLVWEPDAIGVRIHGDTAIIRYRSEIQIVVAGKPDGGHFWHTDSYERRDGQWQAVWSQATRIPRGLTDVSKPSCETPCNSVPKF